VFVTLASVVVAFGVPLRGPDMSEDTRLLAASMEAADSDMSEFMAVVFNVPIG
jgi:hypothetical protein